MRTAILAMRQMTIEKFSQKKFLLTPFFFCALRNLWM